MKRVLLILILIGVASAVWLGAKRPRPTDPPQETPQGLGVLPASTGLEAKRVTLDETVWAQERKAGLYGDVFVGLWDELRNTTDPHAVLGRFAFGELRLGTPLETRTRAGDVRHTRFGEPTRRLDPEAWRKLLADLHQRGYQLVQSEWHHEAFETTASAQARSTVAFVLHVANPGQKDRVVVEGDLEIAWSGRTGPSGLPLPGMLEVTHLRVSERTGDPAFRTHQIFEPEPNRIGSKTVQPLLVRDLDGDGLVEIVLAGCNVVYRNRGHWTFERDELCQHPPPGITGAVLADFTGDGYPDLLCAGRNTRPFLFEGDAGGRFPSPGLEISTVPPLWNAVALTAGDVDGDGDLDAWISQYKGPYLWGQMPTPYYDANDGFPSYLLLNTGTGFVDATEAAGLAAKRFRRTYSNSFVDLDDDGDLDLLVASDFSGIDVYHNDGKGHFTDATQTMVDERHNFAMSHTLGDFDNDTRLDLFVIGMSSTTARRLEKMGLGRAEFAEHQKMRMRMAYGNRMYLGQGDGSYQHAPFRDQVARSGWSWGVTSFDFDNDGDLDLYVANGHQSRETAKDYCTRFWCHDIYLASSSHDTLFDQYFEQNVKNTLGRGMSWNGFEHNHLFVNESPSDTRSKRAFWNIGFLMDVGFEFDARSVVSADLDQDGRVDLLVAQAEDLNPEAPEGERLHVLQNAWPDPNHWIGVRLGETPRSPIGARVTVWSASGPQTTQVVTGESYQAQHPFIEHFGLGHTSKVDSIVVVFLDGSRRVLQAPALDRYHTLRAGS